MTKLKLPPSAKFAVGTAITVVIWAIIGVGIGLVEIYNTGGAQATGTFTFSGNVSNGELVNITNGAAVYRFEFNTTNNGSAIICQTTDCIPVNLSGVIETGMKAPIYYNQSYLASGNLTVTINANASTAALLTAANTTNRTTLTADSAGLNGNTITLSDNAANVASSPMSGGAEPNRAPTAVMLIAQTAVSIMASLRVMIWFIE